MSDDNVIGNRIGRIQILGLLGQGGMGQVYEGFDERLERRVAVKRLDDASRFDSVTRARFEQEAKLLSRLDHPNICRIFDILEEEDHDYLVLELIEGTSLRDLMKRDAVVHSKIGILEQIAKALAAAHSEGVVHRDLKPDNVMVTPDGSVKVLDFGIAHSITGGRSQEVTLAGTEPMVDSGINTIEGAAIGTPGFMSPEQARGEAVTPASDLFSLGLLMQEMLTGEAPYEGGLSPVELLQEVREGRSKPVLGLKRPMTELIERLKNINPVERMTASDVVRKLLWIKGTRQRRMKKFAAAVVAVVVIAGVSKYMIDLRRERSRAIEARTDSEQLVVFLLDDLARDLSPLGRLSLLEKVSHKALEHFEGLPAPLSPEASYSQGRAYGLVADVLMDEGQLTQALVAASRALEIHRALVEQDSDNGRWRNAVADDSLRFGELLQRSGEPERAAEALNTCLKIAETLVQSDPGNVQYLETLGEAHYVLGLHEVFVDPGSSIGQFTKAISIYESLVSIRPEYLNYRYRLAVLHGQGLGQAYLWVEQDDQAFQAVTVAHQMYQGLLEEEPANVHWLFAFAWEKRRLGQLLEGMNRLAEAGDLYAESMSISRRLLSFEPRNISWQEGLAIDYLSVGDNRALRGRDDEALQAYEKAEEIYRTLIDVEPGSTMYQLSLAEILEGQGEILKKVGEPRAAEIVWRRALDLLQSLEFDYEGSDLDAVSLRASLLIRLGREEEAEPLVARLAEHGITEDLSGQKFSELLEIAGR